MPAPPGRDMFPITHRVIVETSWGEAVVIAASQDGNNMHYLVVPASRDENLARPIWIPEGDLIAAFEAPL
jgi:hypothetical protein